MSSELGCFVFCFGRIMVHFPTDTKRRRKSSTDDRRETMPCGAE